jgi:hypothetical protein
MQIIIAIIVILIIIGAIGALVEWIKEKIGFLILIGLVILAVYVLGFVKMLKIAAIIFSVFMLIGWISTVVQKGNEKNLMMYLNKHCLMLGYMSADMWKRHLPQFSTKSYETSFELITKNFAESVERQYIENDVKLEWLDPAVLYLTNNLMADVIELEKVPSKKLQYTHITPNAKLIYEAMEHLCLAKVVDGKHMIQKIQLDDAAVRKELKLQDNISIPEYYKTAYRISDYFANKRRNETEGNIESEEITFDDL